MGERAGKPSASDGLKNRLCPGAHQLCLTVPRIGGNKVSQAGDRIHDGLERNDFSGLKGEELAMAIRCREQLNMLLGLVFSDENELKVYKEERMWYRNDRFSGKPDVVFVNNNTALIADYKTGRIPVKDAATNDQLQWLAVLAQHTYKVNTIIVSIIQPHCGEPSFHRFTPEQMIKVRRRVLRVLRNMEKPNAMLRPGEKQCKYCRAKPICPALKASMTALMTTQPEKLTPIKAGQILDQAQAVKELIKAVEERAEAMLTEQPDAIPGWTMSPGSVRKGLPATAAVFKRLVDAGWPIENIMDAATFSLSKLRQEAKKDGCEISGLLEDLIVENRTKNKLKKTGG